MPGDLSRGQPNPRPIPKKLQSYRQPLVYVMDLVNEKLQSSWSHWRSRGQGGSWKTISVLWSQVEEYSVLSSMDKDLAINNMEATIIS